MILDVDSRWEIVLLPDFYVFNKHLNGLETNLMILLVL